MNLTQTTINLDPDPEDSDAPVYVCDTCAIDSKRTLVPVVVFVDELNEICCDDCHFAYVDRHLR